MLLSFVFRSLIRGISTNLIDWYDYPFVAWVFSQNIDHIVGLNFSNFFQSNILYPYKYTLLLSENFIAPSFLATPFYLATKNLILSFNIVFFLTFVLNYMSSFILWKKIFKDDLTSFFGSLLIVFSPVLHFELSHFQMHCYWPFMLSLYFIFNDKGKGNINNLIFSGVFLAIQFITNLYFAVFLLTVLLVYYISRIVMLGNTIRQLKHLFVVYITFALLSSPFILGHIKANKMANVVKSYGDTITYSAHISDYLFTSSLRSVAAKITPIAFWNSFNKHPGVAFPGFLISVLAIFAVFNIEKLNKKISIKVDLDTNKLFFISVAVVGFVFSLGPRLSVNGEYTSIPLPYNLVVKIVPFIDSIRATSRWSFLFYFAVIYLSILGFSKIKKAKAFAAVLFFLFFILEYIPTDINTYKTDYIRAKDHTLKELCLKKEEIVLEIPITHYDSGHDITSGLNYISTTQLASTYHKCILVNGYSSYDMPSLFKLKENVYLAVEKQDSDTFIKVVRETGATILSYNREYVPKDYIKSFDSLINTIRTSGKYTELAPDLFYLNQNSSI